jgi:hypothetical protein
VRYGKRTAPRRAALVRAAAARCAARREVAGAADAQATRSTREIQGEVCVEASYNRLAFDLGRRRNAVAREVVNPGSPLPVPVPKHDFRRYTDRPGSWRRSQRGLHLTGAAAAHAAAPAAATARTAAAAADTAPPLSHGVLCARSPVRGCCGLEAHAAAVAHERPKGACVGAVGCLHVRFSTEPVPLPHRTPNWAFEGDECCPTPNCNRRKRRARTLRCLERTGSATRGSGTTTSGTVRAAQRRLHFSQGLAPVRGGLQLQLHAAALGLS